MNILVVHNFYQIPGGEDTVVANEAQLLEQAGHTVFVYTRNNSELKEMTAVRKLLLPVTTVFNLRTYKEILALIRAKKIDIVHVHNTLNLISPAVYYAAVKMKVPVVQTIHNFRIQCVGATFYRNESVCEDCEKKGMRCAIKHACYRSSKTQTLVCVVTNKVHRMLGIYRKLNYICLTQFNKEKLCQFTQVDRDKVYVKPNFSKSESRNIIPYNERENQFVFVGRLDKLKGIDLLLMAWKEIEQTASNKDMSLVICGDGPMMEWCRNYIEDNYMKNVELKGFVPNADAKQIIARSKGLILPTQWYEGFPMTIVEAYSVGTPVYGSRIGNVGSLIEDRKTGMLLMGDSVQSISETLKYDADFDCGEIYSYYLERYTAERNYEILIDIYSKCVDSVKQREGK